MQTIPISVAADSFVKWQERLSERAKKNTHMLSDEDPAMYALMLGMYEAIARIEAAELLEIQIGVKIPKTEKKE